MRAIGWRALRAAIMLSAPPLLCTVLLAEEWLRSIDSLSSVIDAAGSRTVVLRGVVTLVRKRVFYIQDQTGAVAVIPSEQARLAIGDEVEIHGSYERRGVSAAIHHATIRKLWSGSAPVPVSLTPEQAAEGSYAGRIVDTEGKLLQKSVTGGYLRLTVEGHSQIFAATLELSSPTAGSTDLASSLDVGGIVRLVGVCAPSAGLDEPIGNAFVILLRSTDDIRVVNAPPWWNVTHAVWVGCGALTLLSLIYWIRHRSLNLRFEAIVEERSRIAREMHDTLAQGFSGLSYQLEGLAQQVSASAEKSSIQEHLSMALQLVRHCREEAHRSIFALRSLTQTNPDLLALLLTSCDAARLSAGVAIRGAAEGKPTHIPDEVLNHLLRIGQEAITNALRYSGADEVSVAVKYDRSIVTLLVSDSGFGFDPARAPSVESGHFGITGMRERARHIRANLDIDSAPGRGTRVSLRTEIAPHRSFLPTSSPAPPEALASESGRSGAIG